MTAGRAASASAADPVRGRAQRLHRRPDGRPAVGVLPPDRVDVPLHRVPHGGDGHSPRQRSASEPGRDGDPEPGADQGELGVVLPGRVAQPGLDALAAQGEQQPVVTELASGPGDPLVVREVRQLHPPGPGAGMTGGHRHIGRVVQERFLGQSSGQGQRAVVPVQDDREVDVPAHQCPYRLLGLHLPHPGAQLGVVGAQGGQGGGEQPPGGGGEGSEQQFADGSAAVRLQFGLGEFELGQHTPGVLGEQAAGIGEPDAAAVPGEQLLTGLALQFGHLLGDGRGGDVQPLGRAAHRAVAGDGVEDAEPVQVQHVSDTKRSTPELLACS
ncbi:hypothetical protein SAMN05192584_10438 [Streptomyces pini]|uniref:Uncharacterized protein n=1 Tax=Streptomyces pini TaxID=1520580 RepID=A0A1I3X557_9ACTN|nr:hypothetical protein SAMN05192584_10438 [Streptomyces pini]